MDFVAFCFHLESCSVKVCLNWRRKVNWTFWYQLWVDRGWLWKKLPPTARSAWMPVQTIVLLNTYGYAWTLKVIDSESIQDYQINHWSGTNPTGYLYCLYHFPITVYFRTLPPGPGLSLPSAFVFPHASDSVSRDEYGVREPRFSLPRPPR